MNVVNKNVLLLEGSHIAEISMAMDNVDHETCIEDVEDWVVEAEIWVVAGVRVISFEVGEEFYLS